ncbi:arginine--tRNA ligase, partial [Candidatus Saganbacteria bacterium]|nr:arginine--tRNA ligase [Candidatus Saganbacteria bacterium]
LRSKIESAVKSALERLEFPCELDFKIDIPPRKELGDYASNVAILAARRLSRNPIEIARQISGKIQENDEEKILEKITVAPPGFINFTIREEILQRVLLEITGKNEDWGKLPKNKGQRVLLEFVSANPTGPLHVGHGRWAVVGDVIGRLLKAVGYNVETEFYVNNVGNQVEKLAASVMAVREGRPVPEGGYGGAYVREIEGENRDEMLAYVLRGQKEILAKLGVHFDRFFCESELHEKNKIGLAVERLRENRKTFEENGALWFKSQELGDDKNRVLIREDGQPTYFAADIAYHLDKFSRGYDRLINIWGTDHHGYVNRLKAAVKALGQSSDALEIIIGQLVTLYRGNEPVRMSKRTGEMVTLAEVMDEIGADATRFFFAATNVNSHMDFDLELAKKQSNENPVYYVQYAHARICSIIKKSQITNHKSQNEEVDLSDLNHAAERDLMLKLASFPDVVEIAAELRQPHRITEYGRELATAFHHFYEKCRVIGNPARLVLAEATRIVLRNVLELLGVTAPETM